MPAARAEPFRGSFAVFAGARSVRGETGFNDSTLQHIWARYGHFLPLSTKSAAYFYLVFKHIHLNHHATRAPVTLHTPHTGFVSYSTFKRNVYSRMLTLGAVIDELKWDSRLDSMNHVAHFPYFCTGSLDTFPVVLSQVSLLPPGLCAAVRSLWLT